MPTLSIGDYRFAPADTMDKFHGNQLLTLLWDDHLMFCAPFCVPVPPDLPWEALTGEVMPQIFGQHPEWAKVDLDAAEWTLNDEAFIPVAGATLRAMDIGHKSVLRFRTPGLNGLFGAHF